MFSSSAYPGRTVRATMFFPAARGHRFGADDEMGGGVEGLAVGTTGRTPTSARALSACQTRASGMLGSSSARLRASSVFCCGIAAQSLQLPARDRLGPRREVRPGWAVGPGLRPTRCPSARRRPNSAPPSQASALSRAAARSTGRGSGGPSLTGATANEPTGDLDRDGRELGRLGHVPAITAVGAPEGWPRAARWC